MKKIISVLLTLIMIFTLAMPAFAASGFIGDEVNVFESRSQVPVIRILGDAEPMYDAEGNKLFNWRSMFSGDSEEDSEEDGDSEIVESVANVIAPFVIDGLLYDNWDPYYEKLEEELSELTGDLKLDCNGNPVEGTGISEARKQEMEGYLKVNAKTGRDKNGKKVQSAKGYYGINDYRFWYDWRLDPTETADKLNDYIQKVKDITGCPKVSIMASCIGTIVTTAYVAEYGVDDIHGIGYTGSVANGAEALSEAISGKFDINSASINRILKDSAYIELFKLDSFISTTIELVLSTGLIDMAEQKIRDTLYDKLVAGVTSALAMSIFFTFPSYWATITENDYEDALLYVFGEEGSAKREEYAGLITKIEKYNTDVRKDFVKHIESIKAGGAKFAAISKYGFQIMPICESYAVVSDQFVSVKRSSFGATTSDIYSTLSDKYIAEREEQGLGKYISPDKQIDASTCIYPESTWFVKNSSHSNYTQFERKLLYDVITATEDITVETEGYPQFAVYDYDTDSMAEMTEENCHTEQWVARENENDSDNIFLRISRFLTAFFNWVREFIIKFIKK